MVNSFQAIAQKKLSTIDKVIRWSSFIPSKPLS